MSETIPVRKEWTIELEQPIESGGMRLSEMKLREPTTQEMAKALEVLGVGTTMRMRFEMQIVLVSLVAGVPRQTLDKVPSHVVVGAANWLEGFSPVSPPTTPS